MKRYGKVLAAALLLAALPLAGCGGASQAGAETAAAVSAAEAAGGTELEIYCFSAGKADAFLLTTENGTVLIDAGEKGFGKEILAYLEEQGIGRIDYFILTHFDQDHVGGAAKVINNIAVGTILQSNHPKDSEEYEKYVKAVANAGIEPVTVRDDYGFTLDGVSYEVNPPRQTSYAEDGSNNSSLAVSVKNGADDLLFAGDAEDARMAEIVSWNTTDYDFLKVPHHGVWHEMLEALLDSVTPEYAVITSSEARIEDARTTALLDREGVETWLTREGPVLITSSGDGITGSYAA